MIAGMILALDIDGDGLLTYHEIFQTHTNPLKKDSDSDGFNDAEEIKYGTNPLVNDSDVDGLLDGEEIFTYHTNPLVSDSDHDGVTDILEIQQGTNPICPDSDGDGLYDCELSPLDPNMPNLAMKFVGTEVIKRSSQPCLKVDYEVLADGVPLEENWIYDQERIINRLDWTNFHVWIDEMERQVSRELGEAVCELELRSANVTIECNSYNGSIVIRKRLVVENSNYNYSEISNYWNNVTIPIEDTGGYTSTFESMHKAFDEYATLISACILMKDHIQKLKANLTSVENWYSWLVETFNGAKSVDDAWRNFQKYAESSGMRDLVEKVWKEISALLKSLPSLKNVFLQYPGVVLKAIENLGISYSISSLVDLADNVDFGSGASLDKVIGTLLSVLEQFYSQLCSEFFSWIESVSPVEYVGSFAASARWYIDHLNEIRALKLSWGVYFSRIIEAKNQYKVGERGVAWWPAAYSFVSTTGTPFSSYYLDGYHPAPTSFPVSEVHWKYTIGPKAGQEDAFTVFLATESLVLNRLNELGFDVTHLPPTEDQKSQCLQMRLISKFFLQRLGEPDFYLQDQTLENETRTLRNFFESFDSISDSISIVEKYGSNNFLEQLNMFSFQVLLV